MNILALDTSGPSAGAAVLKDGELTAEITISNGLKHSQTIMPAVDAVLSDSGLTAKRIDVFACVVGPGSFTGVRIGVCAAKGLAHAANKPAVSVNALEALAHAAFSYPGYVCPMLDARRDQVYAAAFAPGDTPRRVLPDRALSLAEFFDTLPEIGDLLFCGEAAPIHEREILARFGARAKIAPAHLMHVRPGAAADLAMRMGESARIPGEKLVPLYLRAPSAERERAAKEGFAK